MIYYEFTPVDTLFFRGAIPLEAGLPVSDVLFPPPVSVFSGAIRTASGKEFWRDDVQVKVSVIFLKRNGKYYAQAPYSWFTEKEKSAGKQDSAKKLIIRARDNTRQLEAEGAIASAWPLPWIDNADAKTMGGEWIDFSLFAKSGDIHREKEDPLLDTEDRVGVALDPQKRTAAEGRLYTARHIRLRDGVSIVIGLDNAAGLKESGILQLGGEGRKCAYEKTKGPEVNWNAKSDLYVSLAPIFCAEDLLPKVFSAKTFVAAGWDLDKKGHKPSQSWFYAGSVFTENINNQCIALGAH